MYNRMQSKTIPLHATTALLQSTRIPAQRSHKIKSVLNFPTKLITELQPSLRNKFVINKVPTYGQSKQYVNNMSTIDRRFNAIEFEADDEHVKEELVDVIEYISDHSTMFHLPISHTLSRVHRPSVALFKRNDFKRQIDRIASKYNAAVWSMHNRNKFGLFCHSGSQRDPNYVQKSCIYDVRSYIASVWPQCMDYLQCHQVYQALFFQQQNAAWTQLQQELYKKYNDDEWHIAWKCKDPGYLWIYSQRDECRQFIKQYLDEHMNRKWMHAYVRIEGKHTPILCGRPHNQMDDSKSARHCLYNTLFQWNEELRLHYFVDADGFECNFKNVRQWNATQDAMTLYIVVDVDNYQHRAHAMQCLQRIVSMIESSLADDRMYFIPSRVEYAAVLTAVLSDDIHWSILFGESDNQLFVQYDGKQHLQSFLTLIEERMKPNTIIIDGFEHFFECTILRRLLKNATQHEPLRYVQNIKTSLVIYDERIGGGGDGADNGEYKQELMDLIEHIRQHQMFRLEVDSKLVSSMVGRHGEHLQAMLVHCGFDESEASSIDIKRNNDKNVIYIGLMDQSDDRMDKFKQLFYAAIDQCEWIPLSPEQWQYLCAMQQSNRKRIMQEFGKCHIMLDMHSADRMSFYGTKSIRKKVMDRINELHAYRSYCR